MSLISCKECNNMISDRATKCPHCGVVLKADNAGCILASGCSGTLVIIIILLLIFIYGIFAFFFDFIKEIWNAIYG
ncbi:zinc ribbon domain-containing protein [Winogradskyella poriferorum]|uniref:Zinc ribbon domain-containing protein n=2 Tax=Winogradskyella poriferorum TaxID=307627 RepID=A0ABU7W5W1_9FLAO